MVAITPSSGTHLRARRSVCWFFTLVPTVFPVAISVPADAAVLPTAGADIYLRGILPDGSALHGERAGAPGIEGAAAACANCHGRSGLGGLEGGALVPPIAGRYLYRARGPEEAGDPGHAALPMDIARTVRAMQLVGERSAYTDAELARAIRSGDTPDGRSLGYLMPRFRLDDTELASLVTYLKSLSSRPSPGVGDTALEFATVVTPDADLRKRRAMLDVLEHFFGRESVFYEGEGPSPQYAHRFSALAHRWQLHVWELSGAPESWEAQLDVRLRREPVFAVLSGIGGQTWEPVHRFCQRSAVPCLFPNVDRPVVSEQDFYDVYLSKGVLLEAQLIGMRLRGRSEVGGLRVVQLYRAGDVGMEAAKQLQVSLGASGPPVVDHMLDSGAGPQQLRDAVADTAPEDVLVLWLRPQDVRALPPRPPPSQEVLLSGIMGGLEHAPLAAAWRQVALMAYPFDLPDRRGVGMDFPLAWMRFKNIALTDERAQTDTYLACVITAETLKTMGENLLRDYLLETLEMQLGTRLVNGYYPRLELGAGQRFASKGGFLVRFADPEGSRLFADGPWSVP